MYVAPSTNIKICAGVPIANNYKDTLYFASQTAQYNYFSSKAIYTFSDYSYQRVNNDKLRVSVGAEHLYSANYLMFQNENFGTKWFYAFVTNVEYINNQCTELTYEIDRIQTWWFDVTLKQSLVVRQHAESDGIYENLEPEDFNVVADYENTAYFPWGEMQFVVLSNGWGTESQTFPGQFVWHKYETGGRKVDGVYCPIMISVFTMSQIADLTDFIRCAVGAGHEEDIIAVYCGPLRSTTSITAEPDESTISLEISSLRVSAFQGMPVDNNKLYNYPFMRLVLENGREEREFALEGFIESGTGTTHSTTARFNVISVLIPTPAAICYPLNYHGHYLDYGSGLQITDFPQCPIVGDTYAMWFVQNAGGYAMNLIGGLGNAAISSMRGDAVGSFIDIRQSVQQLANFAGQSINASNMPDRVYGLEKSNILSNIDQNKFRIRVYSINRAQANQIDTYFTMYGYKKNKVQTPNIHARQNFTYVQTAGCVITGNAPADDIAFLEERFDSGITWWANASMVGDYSNGNPVLS